MKTRGKGLSLGGTELKFVTGPWMAHEHGENRAKKAEPVNWTPPPPALTLKVTARIFYSLSMK